jgi:hypothetical protein
MALSARREFGARSLPRRTLDPSRGAIVSWASRQHVRRRFVRSSTVSTSTATLIAIEQGVDHTACHHPLGTVTASPGTITTFTHDEVWPVAS